MFDFIASEPHYLEHLVPLWHALEPHERGTFYVARYLLVEAGAAGIAWEDLRRIPPLPDGPTIIGASYKDVRQITRRRVVLLEHGTGQTYGDRSPSNPGGTGREHVALFLCPNHDVADRNATVYPDAEVAVIGCPKLDKWMRYTTKAIAQKRPEKSSNPSVVAVSFHWDNNQTPESRWAYPHFSSALGDVARTWPTIGHGHPRAFQKLLAPYLHHGIEPVPRFDQVLEHAAVYVCDNSSTLYEFAAAGRPVVVLNAPWYRREATHGMRFWDALPGIECNEPGELVRSIALALEDPPEASERREAAVARAFTFTDGHAAERGAEALRRLIDSE